MIKKAFVYGILVVAVASGAYLGWKWWLQGHAHEAVRRTAGSLPFLDRIEFKRLETDVLGRRLHLKDVRIHPSGYRQPVGIADLFLSPQAFEGDIPSKLRLRAERIEISRSHPLLGGIAPLLEQMGIQPLVLNAALEYEFDRQRRTLRLNRFDIEAPGIGSLKMELRLGNVDLQRLLVAPKDLLFFLTVLPRIAVAEARLRYEDDAFAENLMRRSAAIHGKSQAALAAEVERRIAALAPRSAPVRTAADAIQEFLQKPEALCLTVSPADPVSVGQVMFNRDLADLVRIFALRVSVCGGRMRNEAPSAAGR